MSGWIRAVNGHPCPAAVSYPDLFRRMKELRPETPVLLVTGRLMVDGLVAAENASCLVAGIFRKPFDIAALIEKITTF